MILLEAWAWLTDAANWAGSTGIWARTLEHLIFTITTVLAASLIALPAGIVIGHTRKGGTFVIGMTGAFRALPTLGLITLFALFAGIGLTAPFIALVVLALPSLLAGAYSGVRQIDPAIVSAARAMGMTEWEIIRKVEIPLALPVIAGGLRSATLQVVATATLAAYTANVGLGTFLFSGLKSRSYDLTLGSAIIVTVLAIAAELFLATVQRGAKARAYPYERIAS